MKGASDNWRCAQCDTDVESDFDTCWHCGADRQGEADPSFKPEVRPIRDEMHCRACGYLLRGLTTNRCPECGAVFDAEAVDTVDEGNARPVPTTTPAERREWALASLTCWLGVAMLLLVIAYVDLEDSWWRIPVGTGLIVSVLGSIICPIRCFLLSLRPVE